MAETKCETRFSNNAANCDAIDMRSDSLAWSINAIPAPVNGHGTRTEMRLKMINNKPRCAKNGEEKKKISVVL